VFVCVCVCACVCVSGLQSRCTPQRRWRSSGSSAYSRRGARGAPPSPTARTCTPPHTSHAPPRGGRWGLGHFMVFSPHTACAENSSTPTSTSTVTSTATSTGVRGSGRAGGPTCASGAPPSAPSARRRFARFMPGRSPTSGDSRPVSTCVRLHLCTCDSVRRTLFSTRLFPQTYKATQTRVCHNHHTQRRTWWCCRPPRS
jgi:hypothetical protein